MRKQVESRLLKRIMITASISRVILEFPCSLRVHRLTMLKEN
jgi:hypothetical protein